MLDPPRDGIHPKALEKIIDYGVDSMVYISCKPTSLARDLAVLQQRGYKVVKSCCVDMFPNTVHIETVVKLSLKKDTPKIEVTMEPDEESNYTPQEKATYSKIKEYVNDNEKVSTLLTQLSWMNHLKIMSACKSMDERIFYMNICIKEHLSKRELERQIDSGYYERYKENPKQHRKSTASGF